MIDRIKIRQGVYAWIKEDAPIAIQMMMMPELSDALVDKIAQSLHKTESK